MNASAFGPIAAASISEARASARRSLNLIAASQEKGVSPCKAHPPSTPSENTLRKSQSFTLTAIPQSACLRKNAGISKSSIPPDDSASTLAAACVRLVRHTLGTAMPP